MVAVSIDRLVKRFGETEVLSEISLEIDDGAFVAFVGPSGCGKSTLLRVIAGLEAADGGEVRFGGELMNDVPAPDRGAAMVFQSYALYPHLTVWENMSFSLRLAGTSKPERRARAAEVARLLQLDDYLDRRPAALSGGQRQRVAIGRAILRHPRLFLFDEPLSNLDAALRAEMRVELARLHQQIGNTMIYVTHDQVEAMTMSDLIVALDKGRVMQVGAPQELYRDPNSRFVAEFIGSPKMNIVEGTLGESGTLTTAEGTSFALPDQTPARPGDRLALGLRPEALRIVTDSGASGTLSARVDLVEHLGDVAHVHLSGAFPGRLVIKTPSDLVVAQGSQVGLSYNKKLAHVFDQEGRALS